MDPRERKLDLTELINMAMDGRQAELYTFLPAQVVAFNTLGETTVTVQVTLSFPFRNEDGSVSWIAPKPLIHCPVIFPGGGGWSLTFPLKVGDEGVVGFGMRCIDAWWQLGGIQRQAEFRMHDISDGFFFPKVWSKPKTLPAISLTTAQFRSDDGLTFIELAPGGVVNVQAATAVNVNVTTGNVVVNAMKGNVAVNTKQLNIGATDYVNVTSPLLRVSGSVEVGGDVLASFGGNAEVSLLQHVHSGVTGGPSNTQRPVPGS